MVCPLRGGPENDQEACTGRVQCACGVGVCGVGEEPHAEGVLGGGARDSTGGRRSYRVGAAAWNEIDERVDAARASV